MNEEEKRARTLSFMEQEQSRFLDTHSALDAAASNINASLTHSAKVREALSSLVQQGITWDELCDAYHTAFNDGQQAKMSFNLSFFYAGATIAFHEAFSSSEKETADFISQICDIAEQSKDRPTIVQHSRDETGVDTTQFDETSTQAPSRALISASMANRKDREAVEWMRRSGITPKDLEYEKTVGYNNGWNAGVGMSVCYGCAALALYKFHRLSAPDIEHFLERVKELKDDEISAHDIIERTIAEAGVDVSQITAAEATM